MLIPLVERLKRAKYERSLCKSHTSAFVCNSKTFSDPLEHNSPTSILPYLCVTIFHAFDLPKAQQGTLLPQLCPVVLQLPFPHFHLRCLFLGQLLPNGV